MWRKTCAKGDALLKRNRERPEVERRSGEQGGKAHSDVGDEAARREEGWGRGGGQGEIWELKSDGGRGGRGEEEKGDTRWKKRDERTRTPLLPPPPPPAPRPPGPLSLG